MGNFLSYLQASNSDQFQVNYPYYGLFGTANVRLLSTDGDQLFECKLMNGAVVMLKKITNSKLWIDAQANDRTPLAEVIGMYIDDFIRDAK
jgi:hypothetical protein